MVPINRQTLYRYCSFLLSALIGTTAVAAVDAAGVRPRPSAGLIAVTQTAEGRPAFAADVAALRASLAVGQTVRIERVPLTPSRSVDLRLERFRVVAPGARFVVGAEEQPLDFDADSVVLLRGTVEGLPGSHVFLAFSEHGSQGYLDATGGQRYAVSSRDGRGGHLPGGQAAVFEARPAGGSLPPGVPMCGVDARGWSGPMPPAGGAARGGPPLRGLRQIQLAVETDYEFYTLFHDLDEAGAYIVTLYGAISDIYIRDVHASVMLTFVRLWDDPADLFNEPDPLNAFQSHWNSTMGHVVRDAAQFCSGRRNLPAGGVAYLNGLCNSNSYSWGGYVLGYFSDPSRPDIFNRDIMVLAHEIGHNCNTPHTHDLGLDTCNDESTPPRRGTIMAYCGQTFTGGDANHDLWFHTTCQGIMETYINSRTCVAFDCNRNGVSDAADISSGFSQDTNGNGVPDECEDCNGNGVLDGSDIGNGTSLDRNNNGIPDECEPDCNANGLPDDLDFLPGSPSVVFSDDFETDRGWTVTNLGATSGDWERGIPVNDPGWAYDPISDYDGSGHCYLTENAPGNTDVDDGATRLTSPILDLSAGGLNIGYAYFLRLTNENGADRLLVEGSDNGGVGPWRTLATHTTDGGLSWRTHVITAATIQSAGLQQTAQFRVRFTINDANPQSVVEGGLDAFYVGGMPPPPVSVDANANNIPDDCEGDCDGNGVLDYVEIIADMSRDLNRNVILDSCEDCDGDGTPDLVALDHANFVWVAAAEQTRVREYLAKYGTQTLVSADGALAQPQDLIITPDRRVLVSSRDDHRVAQFSLNGSYLGNLVAPGAGGLSMPGAMTVAPSGRLLVASRGTHSVLQFDATTGAPLGAFVASGAGGLTSPFGLAFKPGGNLFVTSVDGRILEYDRDSGAFVREFVSAAGNGGLSVARGILWNPRSGNLLVCSSGTNQVLEYNGTSGAFVGPWSQVGTATVMTLDQPWCLRVGPEGDIYCSRYNLALLSPHPGGGDHGHGHDHDDSDYHEGEHEHEELHLTNARIYHFDADNGYFVRAFIMGVNSGIANPTGFDFVPDAGTDCNYNLRPDSCDIALGASLDRNNNGVPDECEDIAACPGDLDGDGDVDLSDLTRLLSNFGTSSGATPGDGDSDGDGDVDLNDLTALLSAFGLPCP